MPYSAPRLCQGCGHAVRGRCVTCARAADRERGTARERGYDAEWEALRKRFLEQHPTCCKLGCGQPATDVDHIQPVRLRPDLRLTWSNLRSFCHSHHSARTRADQLDEKLSIKGGGPQGSAARTFSELGRRKTGVVL